jgi:hypothetical protein
MKPKEIDPGQSNGGKQARAARAAHPRTVAQRRPGPRPGASRGKPKEAGQGKHQHGGGHGSMAGMPWLGEGITVWRYSMEAMNGLWIVYGPMDAFFWGG